MNYSKEVKKLGFSITKNNRKIIEFYAKKSHHLFLTQVNLQSPPPQRLSQRHCHCWTDPQGCPTCGPLTFAVFRAPQLCSYQTRVVFPLVGGAPGPC